MRPRCRLGKRVDPLREATGAVPMRDSGRLRHRIPTTREEEIPATREPEVTATRETATSATRETEVTATRETVTPATRETVVTTSGIRKIGLGAMQLTSRTGGRRLTNRIRGEKTIPGLRSNRTRRTPLRTSRALRRKKSIIGELWVRTLWNSEGSRPRLPFWAQASQAGAPAPHC